MFNKQGHISRDCRSPQAAELRAKGTIGGPYTKGTSWNKGKAKGKGKGWKGKGINELEGKWPEEPEGENAGDIQAMGGGIQIASVDKFPKPQIYKPFEGKGKGQKGKGTFKPRQSQHLNTFQQQQPPGLKSMYL